jgi:hypothetical protein
LCKYVYGIPYLRRQNGVISPKGAVKRPHHAANFQDEGVS